VPLDYAKKLQSQLPHCTLTVIERCGHAPQLERPRELTRVLLQILASDLSREVATAQTVSSESEENA
jgi:pimeloyl-ACP methyl ester carboxylesterase